MSENDVVEEPTGPEQDVAPQGLHRSTTNRKLAGVAGGIGERFDIDANFVRVAFVVLACVAGLGAAIYLVMWALVPLSGDQTEEQRNRASEKPGHAWSFQSLVLLAGALCLCLIFLSVTRGGLKLGRGIGGFWLIFLVVLAVLSLRRPGRFHFFRFLLVLVLVVVSAAILISGGVLTYVASTGVPMSGGIGQRIYAPASVTQVHQFYRLAIGQLTVDLRGADFHDNTLAVTATVGIGQIAVEVPPGVQVNLSVQSGTSSISYPSGRQSFYLSGGTKSATSHLDLTVRVGIGSVSLYRSAPGIPISYLP